MKNYTSATSPIALSRNKNNMSLFNRFTPIGLTLLFLLCSAPLSATTPPPVDQLKEEQEKLKSETQTVKKQIQNEQLKIEQLKRKIELIRLQNKALDQNILEEVERYDNKTESETNDKI